MQKTLNKFFFSMQMMNQSLSFFMFLLHVKNKIT